jgi:hypothetical protein
MKDEVKTDRATACVAYLFLVRPMRPLMATTLVGLLGIRLSSCVSPVSVDGAPVYAKVALVSAAEIRAAVAADQSSPSQPSNKIYAIEVISKTEIHVHHAPWNPHVWEYNPILKVGGKWKKSDERVIGGASSI